MKFKNTDWSVEGSKHLLEAFAKDLEEAGLKTAEHRFLIHSAFKDVMFNQSNGDKKTNFKLPEQYNEALKYATEKEVELEAGMWYKDETSDHLACITTFNDVEYRYYGFDTNGKWIYDDFYHADYVCDLRPATDKEVESALIAEAKRRGFKKGVRFKELLLYQYTIGDGELRVKFKGFGKLKSAGIHLHNDWIFRDGKWAEIIEDKVPVITVNGADYKAEVIDYGVKFGCARFSKVQINRLYSILKETHSYSNRAIKSITLDSGVEITVDKLKEIKEYLDS